MKIDITWLGHAAFLIRSPQGTFLMDPFLSDNPLAPCGAEDLSPDVILLTHGHADHLGDTVPIAARTGALVIANYEITTWLERQGVTNTHGMNIGGRHEFAFGSVKLTLAHHGSQLPDGTYGGHPAGIVLKLGTITLYHAGDTAFFSDLALLADEQPDLAILPIGDNFTMGPEDAVRAAGLIQPRHVMPCHYNSWPIIAQDPQAWAAAVRARTRAAPVVLEPGQTFCLNSLS